MSKQFKILLVAATTAEIEPTVRWLRMAALGERLSTVDFATVSVEILFTGVGPAATAYTLGKRLGNGPAPHLAIQAGIGGAIDRRLDVGELVQVGSDCFGDLGARAADGQWLSLGDLGMAPGWPFDAAEVLRLPEGEESLPFPIVRGITVSQATGTADDLAALRGRWPAAQVESMEGASFLMAAREAGFDALQLRAISNYVGERDRSSWDIPLALGKLNAALRSVLAPFVQGGAS